MTPHDPFRELLGIEVVEITAGQATVQATITTQHLNQHGSVHGAFLYSLADVACALASNSHGVVAVGLTTSTQYFRPAMAGAQVQAQATEAHLGRRTATYLVRVTSAHKLLAQFTGTVFRQTAQEE